MIGLTASVAKRREIALRNNAAVSTVTERTTLTVDVMKPCYANAELLLQNQVLGVQLFEPIQTLWADGVNIAFRKGHIYIGISLERAWVKRTQRTRKTLLTPALTHARSRLRVIACVNSPHPSHIGGKMENRLRSVNSTAADTLVA
ncbi:hypothetical protein D9757_009514 [Collybiopsis confluens]|uniref:Uncharacterized protein n=1 Tax=Collybiopsis confluens TaxID=2823264 RepID=A0A8H5H8E5_9AGAR|nr:hypothetical protein D9757_013797 [Collybiopsis confluens]KAF5378643.1 hypothetical protein D9757_009514 [Collybiopsis confluens]